MAENRLNWFKFNTKDFLVGSSTLGLTGIGIYVKLLIYQWESNGLPNDIHVAMNIAGTTDEKLCRMVMDKFKIVEIIDGQEKIFNERLYKERREVEEYSADQSKRANMRWSKTDPNQEGPQLDKPKRVKKDDSELKEEYKAIKPDDLKELIKFIKEKSPKFHEPYIQLWNLFASKYNVAQVNMPLSKKRSGKLSARLKEKPFVMNEILHVAAKQSFLLSSSWFNFDFLIHDDNNYVKILDGKYADKSPASTQAPPTLGSVNYDK